MPGRYSFFETVWNDEINHAQKGMMRTSIKEEFSFDDDILYTIPYRNKYRPDRIAAQFFGNPKLFWVLVYVNEINDSPAGFYEGRVIRIPRVERVLELT